MGIRFADAVKSDAESGCDGGWEDKLSGDIYHSSFIKGIPELVHDARSANVSITC